MANGPMMPPARWASGVEQPNFAQPLMDFSPLGKVGEKISGQLRPQQSQQGIGQPMQLAPGPGQGQPVRPQPQTGMGPGMNAMASTANAFPWAQALMRMFGGGQQGGPMTFSGAPNMGSLGGVNPFSGGSPIY